jgi:hypothetical protein
VREARSRIACDPGDLRREPLQPAQTARRLGQLILTQPRFNQRRLIERAYTINENRRRRNSPRQQNPPKAERTV